MLNRWQEKFGFQATFRNLIIAFHNAHKMDYVEVVCKQLGGEWSHDEMGGHMMSMTCCPMKLSAPTGVCPAATPTTPGSGIG